jgi:hypothetical protein
MIDRSTATPQILAEAIDRAVSQDLPRFFRKAPDCDAAGRDWIICAESV